MSGIYSAGAKVLFLDSESNTAAWQHGTVRQVFEGDADFPDALEYDVVLADGSSVVAWPDELRPEVSL